MTLPATAFPLSVSGARILGADGAPVRLAGVNWGGAYADHGVPCGLDRAPRSQIIGWIARHGFNHVRFPFSLGGFVTNSGTLVTSPADPALLAANPDLAGLSRYQLWCTLAEEMMAAGLYVVANQHMLFPGSCCSDNDLNGLWHNDNWPSSTFTAVWMMLVNRFAASPMIGFDLHNEPRKAYVGGTWLTPSWGDGVWATDMHRMYSWHADQIRAAEAAAGGVQHLIFCEGLSYAADLSGWAAHPVTGPNIVASVHDYPWYHRYADGSPQSWADYAAQNERQWGYLETSGTAPVWIGECGSNTDAATADFDHGWFPNFLQWAQGHDSHWCWWALQATENQATQPGTNQVTFKQGGREGFGLMAGQDWGGTQVDALGFLAPLLT